MPTESALDTLQRQIAGDCRARRTTDESEAVLVDQLMPTLLDRRNLEAAWERVRTSDGARTPGVDGQVAAEIQHRASQWLTSLANDLYHQRYQPRPPRWIDVPKPAGGARRLGILTIRDRVVHAAVKQVLEPVLDPLFVVDSFGFRPGRSVAAALSSAVDILEEFTSVSGLDRVTAIRADVADCFDTIDHRNLIDRLEARIGDAALLELVRRILVSGGGTSGVWLGGRPTGLVQGSGLSPLLCNFALDPVDHAVRELAADNDNRMRMLRYADDLLILADTPRRATLTLKTVQRTLRTLRQKLNSRKTGACTARNGIPWLGVKLRPRICGWSDQTQFGYVVPDEKVIHMLGRIEEMTLPPSTRIDPSAFDLGRWLVSINDQLRDWWQAYLFADNALLVFRALDEYTFERVAELLHSITGRRRGQLYDEYRVRLPRGFQSWQIDGCRLTVLSSLAPRRPDRLIRRPVWMRRRSRRDS